MKIRTAFIGYGRTGENMHGVAVEANAEAFEMVGVCDVNTGRREAAAARFGCKVYDDHRAMLETERPDLVCVLSRSDQHCAMTRDCLEAGAHALVTKPWALDEAEARRMIETAEGAGRRLFPWLPARWSRDLARLRPLVADGFVGEVFTIRRAVSSFGVRCDWQTERRFGGGYLLNWGPHIVEPPVLLLDSRVASVYGRLRQAINPGDVEDCFLAILNLENGSTVLAEYAMAAEDLPNWFIQGTQGTIVIRGDEMTAHRKKMPPPTDASLYRAKAPVEEETIVETLEGPVYGDTNQVYAEVAEALRDDAPFAAPPAEALELTRVLDAIRLSSEENRVVML